MYKYLFSLLCCALFCLGCQEEIGKDVMNGSLKIILADGEVDTRTLPSALSDELQQQFRIELLRDKEGVNVSEYDGLLKDFGDKRTLRTGMYLLRASYGENKTLALDEPYYYGEVRDILIEERKANSVTVTCCVANSLATFTILNQEVFDKRIKDYYVKISVDETSVTWQPGDLTHPYFKAGSLVKFSLVGTSVETGQEASYTLNPIEKAEAGFKYNYKLSMKVSNVGFDITAEAQEEPITINETVPDSWLAKAKIFSTDFNEAQLLTYTETADPLESATISYRALRPVQEVEFTLAFADEPLKHLNKTYRLSELSDTDRQALMAANIALPNLTAESLEGSINLAGVTAGMLTHDGGQDTDNTITIRVKANSRWSDTATYTIRTVKPVFKVPVYPGNIWTKEFTANPLTADGVETGNFDKFANITYEFSTDGSNWEAMPEHLQKTALTPGTSYYVRAKYRGEVPGEVVEVKTYAQTVLENGGLENAVILAGNDDGVARGSVYGWNGWATLNNISTPSGVTAYSFNSRSGCRPTDIGHIGKGARVITLGYVIGGFAKPKAAMHSELYLGVSAESNGGREYGIDFNSRPTALGFWYKCISNLGNDVSLVKIQLFHNDVILGENTFTTGSVDSYQYNKLEVNYFDDLEKIKLAPNKLLVLFKSGTKEPLAVSDLKGFIGKFDTLDKTPDATFRGNELFIDDIELIYDK